MTRHARILTAALTAALVVASNAATAAFLALKFNTIRHARSPAWRRCLKCRSAVGCTLRAAIQNTNTLPS